MLLSCLRRSTNLPSAIIARCGYVWLPIGRPSGFADAVLVAVSMNPAAVAPAAVRPRNSRLVIRSTSSLLLQSRRKGGWHLSRKGASHLSSFLRSGSRRRSLARERKRPKDGPDDDIRLAVLIEINDIKGRTHAGLVVHELRHEPRPARRFRIAHGPIDVENRIARWIVVREDVVPGL